MTETHVEIIKSLGMPDNLFAALSLIEDKINKVYL